jgi:heterodisulfide reductase subunit C2
MEVAIEKDLTPDYGLGDQIRQERHIKVADCYQCTKCSSGCPLTFAMDFLPHEIIRLAGLGQTELALNSNTIWVCSSCETCTTRCPNDIDIAGVMDYFREKAAKSGRAVAQKNVLAFHRSFLDDVRLSGGRLNEFLLMNIFMLKSGQGISKIKDMSIVEDLKLGIKMFKKGRLSLKPPQKLKDTAVVKEIFRKAK